MQQSRRIVVSLLVGLTFSMATAASNFPRFSQVWVFGDSLSDTGNTELVAPGGDIPDTDFTYGTNGRFTNGYVWAEFLSKRLRNAPVLMPARAGGTNYAHGGAELNGVDGPTTGLLRQYQMWLATVGENAADPAALYVVWAGSNDLRALMLNPGIDVAVHINERIGAYYAVLAGLVDNGAQRLMVPNVPNLGYSPEARMAGASEQVTQLVMAWNMALDEMLGALVAQTGVTVYRVDMFGLIEAVVADPAQYGLTNISEPCTYLVDNAEIACAKPDQFAFWDTLHPTTTLHRLFSATAYRSILATSRNSPHGTPPHLPGPPHKPGKCWHAGGCGSAKHDAGGFWKYRFWGYRGHLDR